MTGEQRADVGIRPYDTFDDVHRGQKNFVLFCGFYAFLQVKGRFWHASTAVPKLT